MPQPHRLRSFKPAQLRLKRGSVARANIGRHRRLRFEHFENRALLALALGTGFGLGSPNSRGETSAQEVATDAQGNFYLAGEFSSTVDFSAGAGTGIRSASGSTDIFAAKYSQDGTLQWVRTWGSPFNERFGGMAVDGDGNVVVSGTFHEPLDLDPGVGVDWRTSDGFLNGFALKLNPAGELVFANDWAGDFGFIETPDIGVDAAGNVYVWTDYEGEVDFDPGPPVMIGPATPGIRAALIKYDAAGRFNRLTTFGTTTGQGYFKPLKLSVGASGEVYLAGNNFGAIDFDPGPGVSLRNTPSGEATFIKLSSQGTLEYVVGSGNAKILSVKDIAVDAQGRLHAAGDYQGTIDFNFGTGTANRTSAGSTDAYVLQLNAAGAFSYAATMGGTGGDFGEGLTIDSAGRAIIVGTYRSSMDANPAAGVFTLANPVAGAQSVFAVRLTTTGELDVAWDLDGEYVDQLAVAMSANQQWLVVGDFRGQIDLDPSAAAAVHNATTSANSWFLSQFDEAGQLAISRSASSAWTGDDAGRSLAFDTAGNLYLAGKFSGRMDFDPGPGEYFLTATGGLNSEPDSFVAKYSPSGALLWARGWGSIGKDDTSGLVVDAGGNVYVAGNFRGTADFDPGPGTESRAVAGLGQYLLKLDAAGQFAWVFAAPALNYADQGNLALDAAGNVYFAGVFEGTVDFDPGPGTLNQTAVGWDVFLAKFTASGTLTFIKLLNAPGTTILYALELDSLGNAYLTGRFDNIDLDPGPGIDLHSTNTGSFLVKLTSAGDYVWGKSFQGTDTSSFPLTYDLAIDGSGNVLAVGEFVGTVDFAPGTPGFTRTGDYHGFVARLGPTGNLISLGVAEGYGTSFYEATFAPDGSAYLLGSPGHPGSDIDPGPGTYSGDNLGNFLMKLNAAGQLTFAQSLIEGSANQGWSHVALDGQGQLWVTGTSYGLNDVDPSEGEFIPLYSGYDNYDVFVVQLLANPAGALTAIIDGYGCLVISDIGGKNNRLHVTTQDGNLIITDEAEAFHRAPLGGTLSNSNKTLTMPLAGLKGLRLFTQDGDDVVTVGDLGSLPDFYLDAGNGVDQLGTPTARLKPSRTTRFESAGGLELEQSYLDFSGITETPVIHALGVTLAKGYQPLQLGHLQSQVSTIEGVYDIQFHTALLQGTERSEAAILSPAAPAYTSGSHRLRIGELSVPVTNVASIVFVGGGGNDLFVNQVTNVSVRALGGTGNDYLVGGDSDDWLAGAAGNDRLIGGAGSDYLNDAAGDNYLAGGAGNDRLYGGDGNDLLTGGDGNDLLVAHAGNDKLAGGAGLDLLIGGADNDQLNGNSGEDLLVGGALNNSASNAANDGPDNGLKALLASWIATRPANLLTSALSPDDSAVDTLLGELSNDDFYLGTGDLSPDYRAPGQGTDRKYP